MADKLYASLDTSHMMVAEDNENEIQPDMTTQASSSVIEEDGDEGLELKMPGEESDSDEDEVVDVEDNKPRDSTEFVKVDKNKDQKKKVKKNRVGKSYPTQYMRVGAIHCLFLSCFN